MVEKLSHYEILEPLGAGGMGEVFRARDVRLDREVALKVLPRQFSEDRERKHRFLREARLASRLSHPNIATVFEADEVEDTLFFAMELVRGETLESRLRTNGLALEPFLDLAVPLAEGVAEAHRAGVIHRDLKPANIMVDEQRKLPEARRALEEGKIDPTAPVWIWLDIYERNFASALDRLSQRESKMLVNTLDDQYFLVPNALLEGRIRAWSGDSEKASAAFQSALSRLDERLREDPNDARAHASRGIALAGLDRIEEAIKAGQEAVDLMPPKRDAWNGTERQENLARIYTMVGDQERAIDLLKDLLAKPGNVTRTLLQLDPTWEPLADHPDFKQLLQPEEK